MAIIDTTKIDYLWKKIGYSATKTDTNANKKGPNEAIASPLLLNGANTWNRADQIPGVQPGSSTGVVTVFPTSSPRECTEDNTATANRTWKTGLIDWVTPEFGSTYQAKVYIHTAGDAVNALSNGAQVFATGSGNNDEWFFDYQSVVLHFLGTNLPNGIDFTGKSVYIAASRYTGAKGLESIYTYVDSQVGATNTLTIADDGSTTSAINLDNTIQFLGSTGITTSVSGDTLTITGPNLSSYITASSADALSNKTGNISQWTNDSAYATTTYVDAQNIAQSLTFVGDDSTGTLVSSGETFKVAGATGITTAVSGDTLTITGPDLTSYATETYVGTQISNLVASAPEALDTLNELAAALGDDANFATTITNSLASKVAKTDTGLIVVGDDSTGTAITVGETFKVAGAQNITTAVSGDTLTITGPDLSSFATTSYVDAQNIAQSLTFVGDDSTGTLVSSGETFKVAGAGGITTAVSGDTLTITGANQAQGISFGDNTSSTIAIPDGGTLNLVGTGGVTAIVTGDTLTIDGSAVAADLGTFTFSGNKITQTASNADFEIDNAGLGNFTMLGTSALVIPKGTVAERPSSIVAGSIRYNTDNSVYEISEDGNTWLPIKTGTANDTVTNNTVLKTLEYNKLTTSSTVVDEFDQYSTGGAFYHIGIEDISNNLVGQLNINIVHDTAGNAYHTVYDANEDSTDLVSWSTNVSGNNIQLVAQANSSSHVNLKIQKISLSAIDNKLNFTNSSVTTVAEIVSGAKKIISFPLDGFTSAKIYTLFQNTDNNAYEVRELLVARTGTNVYLTGYGNVLTASAPLATYTDLVVGTEVIISASNNGGGEGTITAYSMQVGTGTSIGSYNNVTYNKVGDVDTTNAITVDSFAVASRRTAKYIVNLHNTAGLVQTSEISLIHNGSDAYITEQSISSGTSLGTFTADVNNGRARLRVQGSGHQNTSIVFARFDYEQSMFYKADGDTTGVVRTYGTSALHLPVGTTAQRPSAAAGIIRFNSTTSKYEVSLDSSTWVALKTEATIRPVTKDVFLGDGSTQTFTSANVDTDEENLLVYIDGVIQEPTENYTTNIGASTVTITDEPPHAGARIIIIRGFAEDLA